MPRVWGNAVNNLFTDVGVSCQKVSTATRLWYVHRPGKVGKVVVLPFLPFGSSRRYSQVTSSVSLLLLRRFSHLSTAPIITTKELKGFNN